MAISITFAAIPVLAQAIIDYPVGTIDVVQGETLTLSHRLEWNDPDNPGTYVVGIYWDYFGNDAWHFTVVENRSFFDTDGDNLPDPGVDPIEATLGTSDNGTRFSMGVSATTPDPRDGEFIVEITLRASGPDGAPHAVGAQQIEYSTITVVELTPVMVTPAPITINVLPWMGGIVVRGKANAYNSDATGIPPFVFYDPGDRPPTMAAKRVGDGAFVAAGVVGTCRNGRWNDDSPLNPAPYLDVLFHQAFQWMVSGADNVLWYEGYGVYNDIAGCSDLVDNLTTLGYTVTGDSTEPISAIDLSAYDILILPQLQLGYGPDGGDPSLLPAADITAIVSFVTDGKGLLIMDGNDTFGYNYNKVHNKILEALGSDWWFQHDEVLDNIDSWYGDYSPVCDVDSTTAIGSGYQAVTGTENIGLYSICSLAPVPTFDVDVSISPDEQSAGAGEDVTFVATVTNTGDAWDTYTLDLSDDLGWPELSLPRPAGELTVPIPPTDDTHVCEAFPDTTEDNGTSYNMYVGWEANPYETEGWKTRAYLRFDVSSSPPVISATLNAKCRYGPGAGYPSYTDDNMLVDVKAVSGDAWLENELTWDNAPAVGDTLDTTMIYDSDTAGTEVWYSWDVTSFVTSELAGDGVVSLCMLSENKEADNTDCTVWFYTKDQDGTSDDPYIEVTYFDPEPPPVTTTTVTLGPDESATFDLGVTIDPASSFCTRDTLTIDATSAYTETVVGSGTAKAHSTGPLITLRGVTVEIDQDNQIGWIDPLTYIVTVTNTGELDDMYMLTVEDTEGWGLEVMPNELWIAAGDSDIASLSVTIPSDATGDTVDTVTVTARGTMATGTGEDTDNAGGFDTTKAIAEVVYGVDVEILPCQSQTGEPGSELVWVVKVRNLGNVTDSYTLVVAENVTEGDPWAATPDTTSFLLLPGGLGSTKLSATIPLEAKTSIWNTLTVTATGLAEDVDNCEAHVLVPGPLIPQATIKLTVEAEIIAIELDQTSWDFEVMDEAETKETLDNYFTVRNVGNKSVDISITGWNAKSRPGEPVTTWTLWSSIGVDWYTMEFEIPEDTWAGLAPAGAPETLSENLAPGAEDSFDLRITAPSTMTVPAKMWTLVTLTAVEAAP